MVYILTHKSILTLNNNHATVHGPKEAKVTQKTERGIEGSPWEGQIEKTFLVDWE